MDPIERTSISTLFKLAAIFIPLSSHYEETKLPAETVQWKVPVTQTTHVPGFGTVFNERERMEFSLRFPCHIVHHSYRLAFHFGTSTPGLWKYFNARGTACVLDTVHDGFCVYLSSHTGQQTTFVERESLPAPFSMYCPQLYAFCFNIERFFFVGTTFGILT